MSVRRVPESVFDLGRNTQSKNGGINCRGEKAGDSSKHTSATILSKTRKNTG